MKARTNGIMAAVALVIIGSALLPKTKVESIELSIPDYQLEYDLNTDIPIDISVLPENAGTGSLEYVSDDDSITFSSTGISTGNKEGSYTVYAASGDIKSETIIINVVDMTAREELAKAEAEKAAREAEEKAAREAEEKAAREAEEKAAREAEEKAAREAEEKAAKETASNTSTDQTPKSSDSQGSGENTDGHEKATPTDTNGNENNFNTYDNTEQQNTEASYVLNTSSKKIHHPSCRSVPKIAPGNYSTSNLSVDELINQGYSTCGICFK